MGCTGVIMGVVTLQTNLNPSNRDDPVVKTLLLL